MIAAKGELLHLHRKRTQCLYHPAAEEVLQDLLSGLAPAGVTSARWGVGTTRSPPTPPSHCLEVRLGLDAMIGQTGVSGDFFLIKLSCEAISNFLKF